MSLAPILSKYILFFASLVTSVGVPLVYSTGGNLAGGGGSPENMTLSQGIQISADSLQPEEGGRIVQGLQRQRGFTSPKTKEDGSATKIEDAVTELASMAGVLSQESWEEDTPTPKGEESKKLDKEQIDEFLIPFLRTLETPIYYRGYLNFVNKVRMTLPKDTVEIPTKYWELESTEDGKDKFGFYPNKGKEYPIVMSYRQANEAEKFKELGLHAKKWFGDWNKEKGSSVEEYHDFYYDIKKGVNKTEIVFWKYFKERWYSFELEYSFDKTYSGPVLQLGYVWYKDTNWYGGAYYQAEGGRGYQRHIGATNSSAFGNPKATLNKDFIFTFSGQDLSQFVKWWKILSACSEDNYCRATLEIPKHASDYVRVPLNNYKEVDRDRWSESYHPLQLKFKEVGNSYKAKVEKFKHINSVRGIQR